MAKTDYRFSKKFLWGAAVSAHQVEGGNINQWSQWEQEHAKTLAAQAPYVFGELENWDEIAGTAKNSSNYISGKAADHYRRYEEDFDIVRSLHMNAFRFNIEWSRLEPEQGVWNTEAIAHYRKYFEALEARRITPVVTLFHFTLPTWFAELGGFEKRRNIKHYLQFVEKVIDEYGRYIKYVITINEPEVYASQSYHEGNWPPQLHSKTRMLRVVHNLIAAHNKAAKLIHARGRRYKVSMAYNLSHTYPGDDARLTVWSAGMINYGANVYILRRTVRSNDFIGLNYYFTNRIYGYRTHNPDERLSDLGWDMQPSHLADVLEDTYDRYKKPIMITENGLADERDQYRSWWIAQTLQAMQTAQNNGVDLLGYMHWSLLDNFEWDKGFWPKFGLVEVDRKTMQRTPRKSAILLGRVIKKLRGV